MITIARNGAGVFSRGVADYVNGTVIDETKVNQEMDEIATALTDSIAKNGETAGGVILNEAGAAVDFRVESDTGTHMFFVDGSANRAGVSLSGNLVTDGLFHIA